MAENHKTRHLYEFGRFRLDAEERLLLRDGQAVALTPKVFELLLILVEHHGRLLEKEELFRAVWPDSFVEESNLSSNIALIRKALGENGQGERYIETVPKRGYRFVAEVRELRLEFQDDVNAGKTTSLTDTTPPIASITRRPQKYGFRRWAQPIIFLVVGGLISTAGWCFVFQRSAKLPPLKISPFTSFVGLEMHPSFSPDGNQIAFAWDGEKGGNMDIYVKQVGAEALLRLTTHPAADIDPLWSPDGRTIAFTRVTPEGTELHLISPLGGPERTIAERREIRHWVKSIILHASDWSPDSKWLALSETASSRDPVSLFLLSPESGEKRRITTPPGVNGDGNAAFSPDGKTIAFVRYGSGGASDLYLVSSAGGSPRRLTFDNATIMKLAWMPGGCEILFLSNRNTSGFSSLWRIPAAGGTPTLVESAGTDLTGFAISQQHNRLAWSQAVANTNVWQIELAGTTTLKDSAKTLISSTRQDVSPQFSPDGRNIVFASNRTGSWEIWVCDRDGHNAVRLTSFNHLITGSPRWSPDGRQIVFDARAEDSADIYTIDVQGGKPRRLTTEPSEDIVPSWSHDGQWIYFCSNRRGGHQIWKMPAAGGQAVQVTKHGGFDNMESPDGQYLYYAKGRGETGIWRVPVAGDEETLVLDHHQAGLTRQWAVTAQGIWLVTAERADRPLIEFYNFVTKRVTTAATLEKPLPSGISGLSISPDGRWLLWTQMDLVNSDITLAENFR